MGGGVGVCLYGTHRVAGENIRFAMPETGIGFVPDIGARWFLPRMPGNWPALSWPNGPDLRPRGLLYLGFATHCVPDGEFETIKAAMIEAEPIDAVFDGYRRPGESEIEETRALIDRIFLGSSLADIFRA